MAEIPIIEIKGVSKVFPLQDQTIRALADANLTIAKAQAEALRVQNAALAQNKDVLELRRIEVEKIKAEKWDGALPTAIYAGAPIPFLNVGK